jgi:hypothetical protein
VTHFRTSTQPAAYAQDPQMGGGLAAGGVEVHDVPGYWGSMAAEQRVRVLADQLQACLNKAQAANPENSDQPAPFSSGERFALSSSDSSMLLF